jgi:hypothetical protein
MERFTSLVASVNKLLGLCRVGNSIHPNLSDGDSNDPRFDEDRSSKLSDRSVPSSERLIATDDSEDC